jgi:hypothetical protein
MKNAGSAASAGQIALRLLIGVHRRYGTMTRCRKPLDGVAVVTLVNISS